MLEHRGINTSKQYAAQGAARWLAIEHGDRLVDAYAQEEVLQLVALSAERIPDNYVLCSIGPGSARKEAEIVHLLKDVSAKTPSEIRLIDSSLELLSVAHDRLTAECPTVKCHTHRCDITKLDEKQSAITHLEDASLVVCLGNVVGAAHEEHVFELLNAAATGAAGLLLEYRTADVPLDELHLELMSCGSQMHEIANVPNATVQDLGIQIRLSNGSDNRMATIITALNLDGEKATREPRVLSTIHLYSQQGMSYALSRHSGYRQRATVQRPGWILAQCEAG